MAGDLAGKVAVITGGASGIGRATAELFVEEGARVVIADLADEAGEALAKELGPAALFQRCDVADAGQVQALVDRAVSHFGGLDVMFNNAGTPGGPRRPFLEDALDDFERVMAVNLFGVMVGSRCAAKHMAAHGGGSILNTTSIAALKPGPGAMCYRASKGGVIAFSKSIAIELGDFAIRVNCIAPGLIRTPMTDYDMRAVRHMLQPLAREGLPRDVAHAALYLASERSAQVTGLVLNVDGGTSVSTPMRPPAAPAAAES